MCNLLVRSRTTPVQVHLLQPATRCAEVAGDIIAGMFVQRMQWRDAVHIVRKLGNHWHYGCWPGLRKEM